jgi:hypothetical protein
MWIQKGNDSHENCGTPCTITLFRANAGGHIGTEGLRLSMAFLSAEASQQPDARTGNSKKNKGKVRESGAVVIQGEGRGDCIQRVSGAEEDRNDTPWESLHARVLDGFRT